MFKMIAKSGTFQHEMSQTLYNVFIIWLNVWTGNMLSFSTELLHWKIRNWSKFQGSRLPFVALHM